MLTYSGFGVLLTPLRLEARQIAMTTITVIHMMSRATTPPTVAAIVTVSEIVVG